MAKFRISVTVEASSASEAVSAIIMDGNGEYNTAFQDVTVMPLPTNPVTTYRIVE